MMKKRSFLAMLLIFVMCFALVLSGCNQAGDSGKSDDGEKSKDEGTKPTNQVVDSIDKTLGALIGKDPVSDVVDEVLDGSKITVAIDGMLENVLYVDAEGGYYAYTLKVESQGQSVDVNLYLDGGELALEIPMLLGDQAYGIDFGTLENDLKNSEIWTLLGMSYEDLQNQLGIDIGDILDSFGEAMDAADDMGEAFADVLKDIEVTQEEGKANINGTEVPAINIKYHVTSDDICELIVTALDETEKMMKDMLGSMGESMGMDVDQMMGEMGLEEARQEIKAAFENIDIQGDLVISVSPETEYIMSVTADVVGKVEDEEFAIDMDLVLGENPANSDKYTFSLMMTADGQTAGITAELANSTSGSVDTTTLKVNAVRGQETMEVMSGYLTYDNSNGAYELSLTAGGDTIAFNGSLVQTDDKTDFRLDTMTADGQTQKIGLRVCVESINPSEMPKMPNYKNILRMSADELTELLGGFMGGSMGGNDSYLDKDFVDEDIMEDEFMNEIVFGDI